MPHLDIDENTGSGSESDVVEMDEGAIEGDGDVSMGLDASDQSDLDEHRVEERKDHLPSTFSCGFQWFSPTVCGVL
ncbi:hypothetical protein QFC24_001127 [Naganishia onofrii]|uniref:Uncharacterized protein n=1 Tax=Naganishia onofrii TaxID=1851511 RepID=A0ACC2XUP4_9TREE|nr:hypothetical protein QFC24_001127 [Naganishia onofrii]